AASSRTSVCSGLPFPFTSLAMRRSSPLSRLALGRLVSARQPQVRSIAREDRLEHRVAVCELLYRETLGKPPAFNQPPIYQLSRASERAPLQFCRGASRRP